jgi:hypothetical protein
VDDEALAVVKAHIDPDETILWVGRPSPLAYALRSNVLLAVMGLAGVGMMVSLFARTFQRRSTPSFFSIWDPLFYLAISLFMATMAAAPLWTWLRARATVYALTDRRALIVTRFAGLTVTSVEAHQIRFVELATRGGGRGTVSFLARPPRQRGLSLVEENGFHEIEDAPHVARLMRERLVRASPVSVS